MTDTENGNQVFWAWDQYWQDGRLASCGGEGGAAYQAAITERWREYFRTLPDGSRILDVCTGNGAIALVAEETAEEQGIRFEIEAFDGAIIGASGSPGCMIRFRSRVQAESLPYPDNAFDVVVGQYGLEYSDMERSVPELARVSTPGSRLRLMTHALEGVVVGWARQQLEDTGRLLDSAIFPAAHKWVEAHEAGVAETVLRALTEQYNEAVGGLEHAAVQTIEPMMYSNVCSVLTHALSIQRQVGAGPVHEKIDEVAETVRAHAERLDAMCRAALNKERAEALGAYISELWGYEVSVNAGRRADGDLLGWIIESL